MMKTKKITLFAAISVMAGSGMYVSHKKNCELQKIPDVMLENVAALAGGEDPVAIGCEPYEDATCYVFNGNGQLVDKRKDQYPGRK